ncbi:MAG: hypothetical protein JWP80_368 [Pseudomonas sp.]|nr:hypothetical protein [Pseudomonas sp.]
MTFKNRPAVNDPDLIRPSPDVVNQAYVVLALKKHYQKGFSQGLIFGAICGGITASIVSRTLHWLF